MYEFCVSDLLCHLTFAMTGALAWQVKRIHNKKKSFGVEQGSSHGVFFAWVLSCSLCVVVLSIFMFLIPYQTPL